MCRKLWNKSKAWRGKSSQTTEDEEIDMQGQALRIIPSLCLMSYHGDSRWPPSKLGSISRLYHFLFIRCRSVASSEPAGNSSF